METKARSSSGKSNIPADDSAEASGPGAFFMQYVVMEDLLDKLKLLNYGREFLKDLKMKSINRHYFAIPTNPGEQFYMFAALASWLIRKIGKSFETPLESDDPNSTIATILDHVRKMGVTIDFSPGKLKQGYGEHVIFVLDRLADEALKTSNFSWNKPIIPKEEVASEEFDSDSELNLEKVEEEMADQYSDEEEVDSLLHIANMSLVTNTETKKADILESNTDSEAWKLELERVTPHLKIPIKSGPLSTEAQDWRTRLDSLKQHQENLNTALSTTNHLLERLQTDVNRSLDKIAAREKFLNAQLAPLLANHRKLQEQWSMAKEKYRSVSGGIVARNAKLNTLEEELQVLKRELEERSSNMTDGMPMINIKKALARVKGELAQMEVRMGVVSHSLLQARLRERAALVQGELVYATMA
nr:EOG090X0ADS [Triops cancriformis]